jgi:iron complex transport system ATP-binding protein
MTAILAADSITVRIGRKTLLDAVSLALEPGEVIALVGPNGAGKSTLLRVLSGDLAPRPGVVRLRGRDLASFGARDLARHRAVLSQKIAVTFPFTVAEIVQMGAGDQGGPKLDDMIATALAEVDLTDFHDRVFATLSGGEQQRAHFARVLVQLAVGEAAHGPGVLLLDEPTASLDLKHQLDLARSTRRCAERGVAAVVILHDLNLATLFAGRIAVLYRGKIAGDGPADRTITDAMLGDVFEVSGKVGQSPPSGVPFVLPQTMEPHARRD